MTVPSNLVPTRVSQLPEYSGSSTEGYSLYIVDGVTYKYQLKYAFGSVTSVAASGGSTGMSFGGSPIINSGTLTLNGTLNAAHGGTGHTIFSDGELLIGKTDGTLAKATLIAGTGMVITNGDGSITLSSPSVGTVTSVNASGGTTGLSFTGGPVTSSGTLTLGGTLVVANGGTGAATLTGYVKGSGTSAMTASATIPGSDISGNISGNAANVTGVVAVANGGTGASTLTGYVKGGGTSAMTASATIPGSDINGSISGNAANVTGVVAAANGGTGLSSYTTGDLVYASGAATLAKLADVATGSVLISGGVGVSPSYGKVGLSTHVSGTLPTSNGGTGQTTFTDGQLLIGKTDGTLAKATITAGSGISITNGDGSITVTSLSGGGSVTSVDASGGTTGLSFSGGPVVSSGTLTLGGTLAPASGGTGQTTFTDGQLLIGKTDGTLAKATLSAGTGISITNGNGTISISAPDTGTVTSVDASGGTTGLSFSGGPVTSSGTLTLAGTLAVANGGTGISSYAVGDLIYANGTTGLSKLADVATGNVLISGGVGTAPSYGKVGLTTHISGTLPVANGGTNITSYTKGDLVYASGATTLASLADVATGNVLLSGGVGADPAYGKVDLTTHISGILPAANGGTGNGFFAVSGPASSTKTFTFPNTSATVLTTNAAVTVAQGGTGIVSGTSGGVPYFSGSTAIASSAALAANALVIGGGAGAAPSTTTTASGILTFLGTPSSANLAAAVTDETGSGALVFATSPTLVTPTLGVATATSVNGSTLAISTRQVLLSGSGATYTTPANCRQLRITIKGGGGGGGGTGTASATAGGTGGTSSFDNASANVRAVGGSGGGDSAGGAGGTGGGGTASYRVPGAHGDNIHFIAVSSTSGRVYGGDGAGPSGGGGATYAAAAGTAAAANSGGGGGGASTASDTFATIWGSWATGGGGGEGETAYLIINNPTSSYTYTIGAAGSAGSAGTSGAAGGAGGSGYIVVDEFY